MGNGRVVDTVRGRAPASDWWDWERSGHAPLSGDGNGFGTRFSEDFALLAGLGLTHHRLSIEWARLEPELGVHDPAAVRHYREVLTAAQDAGISPWVSSCTTSRFPAGSWPPGDSLSSPIALDIWRRHVDFIADTFGDLVASGGSQWSTRRTTTPERRMADAVGHPVITTRLRSPWSTRRSTWPTPRPP